MRPMPTQNSGMAPAVRAYPRMILEGSHVGRMTARNAPESDTTTTAIRPISASSRVAGKRVPSSLATDRPLSIDVPRSKWRSDV